MDVNSSDPYALSMIPDTKFAPELALDRFVKAGRFVSVHSAQIATSRDEVISALWSLTPADIPLGGSLLAIRLAIARLAGKPFRYVRAEPLVTQFLDQGFVLLADERPSELVLGAIGRFWRPTSDLQNVADANAFVQFHKPGFCKAAVSFHCAEVEGETHVSIETRVLATDARADRAFAPYWVLVRTGGGILRWEMLAAVKRKLRS